MLYDKRIVKVPKGFKVGAEVYIRGEANDIYTIVEIGKNKDGEVVAVYNNEGFREALCQYCLVDHKNGFQASWENEENQITVEIGECDVCGKKFNDRAMFLRHKDDEKSMVCKSCQGKKSKKEKKDWNLIALV